LSKIDFLKKVAHELLYVKDHTIARYLFKQVVVETYSKNSSI